ncbi:hypothetical protein [Enterococcus rotai]|uniref:hypothetical protein n=1 Tax=Enterococcus rotai TaxID=118060 RepID=UPI0035C6D0DF
MWSVFLIFTLAILYGKINLITTGLMWLSVVMLVFSYLKKINRAILVASVTILTYIFANYLLSILLSLTSLYIFSTLEALVISSSIMYLVMVFGLKKITTFVIKKVQVSERLVWLTAILSTITFISYFVIIIIERFGGEHSAMGKANEFFIIGYGLVSMLVFLVLLYSLQKEYTAKEKQQEMIYLKEYTDQLEKKPYRNASLQA